MPLKPKHFDGYSPEQTELAESVLLDVWSRLGEYHNYLVLIGGMIPKYLVPQPDDPGLKYNAEFTHCGTMDVDLGISIGITDKEVYKAIHDTIIDDMGFKPGKNLKDNDQKHSFVRNIDGMDVNIDFLTTEYGGPDDSLMRKVQSELTAIQVEGLGMALDNPQIIEIRGELLDGRGMTTENVRVCRPVPFVVLKALAFDKRRVEKDAYDLIYVLRNSEGGANAIGKMVTDKERELPAFQHALKVMKSRFRDIGESGPRLYSSFLNGDETMEVQAVAAVRDFLRSVSKK